MRVYIETYGCSANQAESEIMAGILKKAGFILSSEDDCDITIINSCIVKEPTEQKFLYRINQIRGRLIIAGCAPEVIHKKITDVAPSASLVSTHHITRIAEVAQGVQKGKRFEFLGDLRKIKLNLPRIRKNPVIGIVQISSGCNSSCAYCCVRPLKGSLNSYPKEQIIKEVSNAVNSGCKEIWLTSQDNSCYGFDKGGNLPELLNAISQINGKFRVRVGMMNPRNLLKRDFIDSLIKAYRSEKIYKFLHLPVQSGSDKVLKKMRRGYTAEDYKSIVSIFRTEFPTLQLWTDVIAGFPGETDRDFLSTVDLLKKVRPDFVNISKYGVRESAPSSKMKQLPTEIKKERSAAITRLAKEISFEKNKEWTCWEGEALITEKKKNGLLGRNFAYKPITLDSGKIGEFVKVKILDENLRGKCLLS